MKIPQMNVYKTPLKILADPKSPNIARDLLSGMFDAFALPESFFRLLNQNVIEGSK